MLVPMFPGSWDQFIQRDEYHHPAGKGQGSGHQGLEAHQEDAGKQSPNRLSRPERNATQASSRQTPALHSGRAVAMPSGMLCSMIARAIKSESRAVRSPHPRDAFRGVVQSDADRQKQAGANKFAVT